MDTKKRNQPLMPNTNERVPRKMSHVNAAILLERAAWHLSLVIPRYLVVSDELPQYLPTREAISIIVKAHAEVQHAS